jgi:hypothetical protein
MNEMIQNTISDEDMPQAMLTKKEHELVVSMYSGKTLDQINIEIPEFKRSRLSVPVAKPVIVLSKSNSRGVLEINGVPHINTDMIEPSLNEISGYTLEKMEKN